MNARSDVLLLPNEDRTFGGNQLFVDLIPASCWFTNVRTNVTPTSWNRLRKLVYGRANNRCEICGEPPSHQNKMRLEAHERWSYHWEPGMERGVQTLRRLICLCNECHRSTHMGLAFTKGYASQAIAHLMRLHPDWSDEQVDGHIERAFILFEARSAIEWDLDLSMLLDAGYDVTT